MEESEIQQGLRFEIIEEFKSFDFNRTINTINEYNISHNTNILFDVKKKLTTLSKKYTKIKNTIDDAKTSESRAELIKVIKNFVYKSGLKYYDLCMDVAELTHDLNTKDENDLDWFYYNIINKQLNRMYAQLRYAKMVSKIKYYFELYN
jgi:hypothetical protein